MNIKFLDKVIEQIISETRVIDDKVYTPFFLSYHLSPHHLFPSFFPSSTSFPSHCKDVYSLNKEETEYVWGKYKKGLTALINKKELV